MEKEIYDVDHYGQAVIKKAKEGKFLGRMNDPTSSAYIKGVCGDEMEFYLVVKGGIIDDVKYFTDGCPATRACGETAASLAFGKSIEDALNISPKILMDILGSLPKDHRHCSILAVSTLYKAIADYLLKY